jgi:pyruvate dehydrogenase E1 component alpha subunit
MTFRFHGHVFGDDDAYMPKEQKQAAIAADPVPRFRAKLIADGVADEATLAAMEAAIEAEIDEAVEFALASPLPDVSELKQDVYADASVIAEDSYA